MAKRRSRAAIRNGVLAALACAAVATAEAEERLVRLLTESPQGRFRAEPALVMIEPGDQVRFRPDSRLHAAKSVGGMQPEGSVRWWGRMGEETLVRFDRPGVYGFKCEAHYELGMVGLIVVGRRPANWAAAKAVRHPPKAAEAFQALFAAAACRLDAEYQADCRRSQPQ